MLTYTDKPVNYKDRDVRNIELSTNIDLNNIYDIQFMYELVSTDSDIEISHFTLQGYDRSPGTILGVADIHQLNSLCIRVIFNSGEYVKKATIRFTGVNSGSTVDYNVYIFRAERVELSEGNWVSGITYDESTDTFSIKEYYYDYINNNNPYIFYDESLNQYKIYKPEWVGYSYEYDFYKIYTGVSLKSRLALSDDLYSIISGYIEVDGDNKYVQYRINQSELPEGYYVTSCTHYPGNFVFSLSNAFRHGNDYYTFKKITFGIGTAVTGVGTVTTNEISFYLIADSDDNVRVVSELPDDYYIIPCSYGCYLDYRNLQYVSNDGVPLAQLEYAGDYYGTPKYTITYLKEFSESEKFYTYYPEEISYFNVSSMYYLNNIIYNNYDREYKIVDVNTDSIVHFTSTENGIVEDSREVCKHITDIDYTYYGDYNGYSYYRIPYAVYNDAIYLCKRYDVVTNSAVTCSSLNFTDFSKSDTPYHNDGIILKLDTAIDINSLLFVESSNYQSHDWDTAMAYCDLSLLNTFNIGNVQFSIEYLGCSEENLAMYDAIGLMPYRDLYRVISGSDYAVFLGDYIVGPQGLNAYIRSGGTRSATEKAIFMYYNIFGTEIRGSLKSFLASVSAGTYNNIWDIDLDNKILYFKDDSGNITAKMDHAKFGVIPSMGYDTDIGGFYRYKQNSENLLVDICTDNIFTDCTSDIDVPSNFTGRLEVCTYSSLYSYKPSSTYNKTVYYYKNGVITYYDEVTGSSYHGIASLTRHYLNDMEYTYSYDNYYNNLLGFQASDGVRINASDNSTNGNSFVQEQVIWDNNPVYARWSVGFSDYKNKLYPQGSGRVQIVRSDVSYQYDGSIVLNKNTFAGNVDLISVQIPSASIEGNIDLVLYYPGYGMLNFIKTEDDLYQAAAVNESGVIPFVLFLKHDDSRTNTITHNRACIRQVSDEPTLLDTSCIMQNYITPIFDVSNYIQLLLSDFNSDSVIDTEDVALHLQYLRDN